MTEIQKGKLFFLAGNVPLEVFAIASKYGAMVDGEVFMIKYNGDEIVAEEISLIGEEEAVNKAWEEVSQLSEYINSGVELFTRKEMAERYIPVFNMVIENMRRNE
jgi:hypothetical protein